MNYFDIDLNVFGFGSNLEVTFMNPLKNSVPLLINRSPLFCPRWKRPNFKFPFANELIALFLKICFVNESYLHQNQIDAILTAIFFYNAFSLRMRYLWLNDISLPQRAKYLGLKDIFPSTLIVISPAK